MQQRCLCLVKQDMPASQRFCPRPGQISKRWSLPLGPLLFALLRNKGTGDESADRGRRRCRQPLLGGGGYRTPLFRAAEYGHVSAVRELLRAKANPLLGFIDQESGATVLPLDTAALGGHWRRSMR